MDDYELLIIQSIGAINNAMTAVQHAMETTNLAMMNLHMLLHQLEDDGYDVDGSVGFTPDMDS